jgi:hypothetical protein
MSKELDNEIARITGDVDALSELVSEMKVSAAGVSFRQHGLRIRSRETKEKGEI